MDGIVIIGATQQPESVFHESAALGQSLQRWQRIRPALRTDIAFENGDGLSTVYNRAIDRHAGSADVLLFVHDDLFLNDLFLFERLAAAFESYDVVGIAGSTYLDLSAGHVGWHAASPPEAHAGSVMHPMEDRKEGVFFHLSFGPTPLECLVVDGVFMAMKTSVLKDVRFDEQFTFDFYDLDVCLAARQAGHRVGVAPILTTHLSHGAGLGGERFMRLQERFVRKWLPQGEDIPSPRGVRAALRRHKTGEPRGPKMRKVIRL